MNIHKPTIRTSASALVTLGAVALLLASCGGGGSTGSKLGQPTNLSLTKVEYGRLVDILAYRRIGAGGANRLDELNRNSVLVEKDVVIDAEVESQSLFDALGQENVNADYRFLSFDVNVGHEQLLILWDDTDPVEGQRFQNALQHATSNLSDLPASFREQNTGIRPISVVPRNAAIKLTFSGPLGSHDTAFFAANPFAIQVLEILGDPTKLGGAQAFRLLPDRLIAKTNAVIIDPTLIGGEAQGTNQAPSGLPASADSVAANIRIAIPTTGAAAKVFGVKSDPIKELNGLDGRGDQAVIRDLRAGNPADGRVGSLVDTEAPMLVTNVQVGIIGVDMNQRVLTINKRGSRVAVRGRIPFVSGALRPDVALPGGPSLAPTIVPLRAGDTVMQDVDTPAGTVHLSAEVLENLDVGNVSGGTPVEGLTANNDDGGDASVVRVKLASLTGKDGFGNPVTFQTSDLPLGADATLRVHYYEYVPHVESVRSRSGGVEAVSDARIDRRAEFLTIDPAPPRLDQNRQPVPPNTLIDLSASVGLRFSEPMDLETISVYDNYFIASSTLPERKSVSEPIIIDKLVQEPKPMALSIQAARLVDREGNGTVLRIALPLGHFHVKGQTEGYWFHALLGELGPKDLGGNAIDLFDLRPDVASRVKSFSTLYSLDPDKDSNLIASRVMRFESPDEDGTRPGSVDYFGQFQLRNGQLFAAPVSRFSRVADGQTLQLILRGDKGECYWGGPLPPKGYYGPIFPLYTTPSMVNTNPNPPVVFTPPQAPYTFGGIVEPHNPRGTRLQETYREDDFQLGYTDPTTMMIDVEQLHWAPWLNKDVIYDVFDRYTLELGHADRRPDLRADVVVPMMGNPVCGLRCESLWGGLVTTFDQNVLAGTTMDPVVKDKVYAINPNDAFRASTGTKVVPYPRFDHSYTWRDSRLVQWDPQTNKATGLGGAKNPAATPTIPPADMTTDASSPWIIDTFLDRTGMTNMGTTPSGISVVDLADFLGDRKNDMDPIALPLLAEFQLWKDDPANGSAIGGNQFHIAFVGPNAFQAPYWGYYNSGLVPAVGIWMAAYAPISCAGMEYTAFRVHTSGGIDLQGQETFINPLKEDVARGGWILDAGLGDQTLGRYQTKPADDHLYWAQADFVRKVSLVTFGYFDTLKPNQHALDATLLPDWPGANDKAGFPDFTKVSATMRIKDMIMIQDPPEALQPKGTSVTVEFRGTETIGAADPTIYDRAKTGGDAFATRGNLLNPSYACEAFRYAMDNPGPNASGARIAVTGMTPYADLDHLDDIRQPFKGVLPRYVNFRFILQNDLSTATPRSPALKAFAVVYRMAEPNQ